MTNSGPNPPQTRRNRKVSALTAQQAQHKRDLDRRAQRALRQRVKSRLQDLEDDLARAKTDCSVRERKLMDEVHLLREENRELRSYLDSIGQFALNGAAETDHKNNTGIDDTASPDPDRATTETEGEPILENDDLRGAAYDEPQREQALVEDTDRVLMQSMGDIDSNEHTRAQSGQGMTTSAYTASANMSMGHPRLPSPETEASLSRHQMRQFAESRGERMQQVSQSLPQPILASPHSISRPIWPSLSHPTIYQPPLTTGIAAVLPKHTSATCPLDQILLDFIDSRRSMVAKGYDVDSVLGPIQPSLQAILHPGPPSPEVHAASRVLGEVLTTFPYVASPQKLAFMFVMYRTMRWQISPTDANYEQMPRWLRPTAMQITVPHASWIDNIPWPRVRDLLIEHPEKYPFAAFSELYSQNITVNWPYEDMDTVSTHAENIQFNNIFEKHVRKLSNWTVSEPFKDYLPEMIPAIYEKD